MENNLQEAHDYAYGNQSATDKSISEIIGCDEKFVSDILYTNFEMKRCSNCEAYEYEYEGDYVDGYFICEDCLNYMDN